MSRLEFERDRRKAKTCPCGKSNANGKFSPFKGYTDKGHCFGCTLNFFPNPAEIMKKKDDLQALPPSYISEGELAQSLIRYDENILLIFLAKLTNQVTSVRIKDDYQIGTSRVWSTSTVFWQIDIEGKIRDGKIIQYRTLPEKRSSIGLDCCRVQTNLPPVKWVSKMLNIVGFNLRQCFFGEHLLVRYPEKKVGVLESEKSVLIASAYHPEVIWLACGGADGLSNDKIKVLEGRDVTFYPDLGKFELWKVKADKIRILLPKARIRVWDVLERTATEEEKKQGLDLADFLIRHEWANYGSQQRKTQTG